MFEGKEYMQVIFKCLGAAQTVTGSKYLVDVDQFRLMVDCGIFQGLKEWRLLNWSSFPIEPTTIHAIVLTHAHIDHIGYLPRLYKQGFRGPVYCTETTAQLIPLLLKDAAKLQEEEAAYAAGKGYSKHSPPLPLYTVKDVEQVLPLLVPLPMEKPFVLHPAIELTYYYAGHIAGAASILLNIKGRRQTKQVVFSGDLGSSCDPLLKPPTPIPATDCLIVESTYGGRFIPTVEVKQVLAQEIQQAFDQEGCVVIPAFAVGRTQTLLYYLKQIIAEKKLTPFPVYVDSPMAIQATELYAKYLAKDIHSKHRDQEELFHFPSLHFCQEIAQSKQLNEIDSGAVIISASGMATGGRVLHHLYHRLRRAQDTVLLVGYQAEGTRGRRLLDGEPELKIFGEYVPVKCRVRQLPIFSAHADHAGLMQWLERFQSPPAMTFITHGEKQACFALKQALAHQLDWHNIVVPQYLESFILFEGI